MKAISESIILVVDDTETNIDILVDILGDDYKVRVAMDGPGALEAIESEMPDLILLDVMMPGMDGYEVCERIKANDTLASIPVIFITAMNENENETKGLGLGAIDYITKPINAPIVKARIRNHLELKYYRDNLEEMVQQRTLELSNALEEVKETRKIAERANEAKAFFLSNMSHEFRTPMNGILGVAEMLKYEDLPPDLNEFIEMIHDSGQSLSDLINKILAISSKGDDNIELVQLPFHLIDILNTLPEEFFYKGNSNKIKLKVLRLPPEIPSQLIGDKECLLEIFKHLLDNATKFSEKQPEAVITTRLLEKKDHDVTLEFSVQDNGIGISPENHSMIFEPFIQIDSSVNRQFEGAGLGLTVVRRLIRMVSGDIRIESNLGLGCTVFFSVSFKTHS